MTSSQHQARRKKFAHIPAALTILFHAFERYETGHSSYLFFTIAGLLFLSITLFHHPLAKRLPWIDGVFFIIEGCLSLVVFYEFLHAGKKALPVVYLLLALFQFFMAYKFSRKGIRNHRENPH